MRRLVTMMAVLVCVFTVSSNAFAQRDSGAKARGDNDSFWSPRYSQRSSTKNGLLGRQYRGPVAPLRQAARTIAAPQVTATAAPANVPAVTSSGSGAVRSAGDGSFARAYSNSRNTASKPAWMYPKTDPRRYRS